ncbi:MAG: hypothetical protein SFW67_27775 [Myxococcaceae bacterium]|nr:hypothetical protein [Myxococcaceae bacterium]
MQAISGSTPRLAQQAVREFDGATIDFDEPEKLDARIAQLGSSGPAEAAPGPSESPGCLVPREPIRQKQTFALRGAVQEKRTSVNHRRFTVLQEGVTMTLVSTYDMTSSLILVLKQVAERCRCRLCPLGERLEFGPC